MQHEHAVAEASTTLLEMLLVSAVGADGMQPWAGAMHYTPFAQGKCHQHACSYRLHNSG